MADVRILGSDTDPPVSSSDPVCGICGKQISRYTCPRCNLRYCTLTCYKSEKHADCTETFYKESFVAELEGKRADDGEKKHMLDILKRFEEEQQDPLDPGMSLEERLADVDLDQASPDDMLSLLTPAERQEFELALKAQALSHIIPVWTPWWMEAPPKVVALDTEAQKTEVPDILQDIKPLEKLTKQVPADSVLLNVVDILYSYVEASRYFNGDWSVDPEAACAYIWESSGVLSSATPSAVDTVDSVLASVRSHSLQLSRERQPSMEAFRLFLNDISLILTSLRYTLAALSDMYRLFESVSVGKSKLRRRAFLTFKKIYFYVAWIHGSPMMEEGLSRIARGVGREAEAILQESERLRQELATVDKLRRERNSKGAPGPGIVEL
ncbi:hypothetical protein SmJEL517_g00119 [Synchytrium microbalum]|uniref:HIT-type domain-containing protein n=1 Tax=Synchytrium microbalum TaxID=1806994 RepID=A0A507CFB8_9FUNG|nr:uncharacterized protein SmJEL517_g00119 [Synchytrium microbalum]TPX38322.1 hypothetical protein SmJEL517_g00119 [Synchytrium microbalum]